ncbi:ABC transporter ATP-binding protein [Thermogladius sp. 4427co]|uniref:ABC transporter ATP-binding protein n=1 Tax=Thermogladius sp. 4427co TaxID=3450718 RepID=UPI003F79AEFD
MEAVGLLVKDLVVEIKTFRLVVDELVVRDDEIAVITGPNGAGKTTLIKAIAGLIKPSRGLITIGGEVVFKAFGRVEVNKPPEKRRVGYLPQNLLLFPHMTVYDNVAYAIRGRGIKPDPRRVREILEFVGLKGLEKRKPGELSYGQQQRLALARALAVNSRLLLLDEPFSSIDIDSRRELRKEIARLIKILRIPTLIVSHDVEDSSIADAFYSIDRGILFKKL